METITLSIDGQEVSAPQGATILESARTAEIYIPSLCHHPDLPKMEGLKPSAAVYRGSQRIDNPDGAPQEAEGCGLCLVEIEGQSEPVLACSTPVQAGMKVLTNTDRLKALRQEKLAPFLAGHPHACLTCAQAEGCSRTQCSSNVPEEERCCPLLGNCEFQKLVDYVGILPSVPRWQPTDLPLIKDEPLFERNYNLCLNCTRCVRACQELRGVGALGFVFDQQGRVVVGTLAPSLAESGCKFCTACVEVCPTGAILDKGVRPALYEEDLVPCRAACPAGVDVPHYLRAIKAGQVDQALAVIREKVPLPGVLGRVCVHPCEEACRRGEVNEPLAICALKRYAADKGSADWKARLEIGPASGKRVAVVGSGPAGLTAAFYLAQMGHLVKIFERADKPGGMLCQAIPAYRLPREVVEAEIQDILDLGVELETGVEPSAQDLQSFDAVFLGLGAQLSRRLDIPGSQAQGVLWGVDFLRDVRQDRAPAVGAKVIVVGGGNVALDVALTARRLGGKEVSLVCLESLEEMPAHSWEVAQAQTEGVKIINGWGPKAVLTSDGRACGLEFMACISVFDDKGRFNPTYDDCQLFELEAETVILAIGQASDLKLAQELGVEVKGGLAQTDSDSQATNVPGLFVGGDMAQAPGSIVQAVAQGRRAAAAVDRYLGGSGQVDLSLAELAEPDPHIGREEGFAGRPRQKEPALPLTERGGFEEVNLCFSDQEAQAEAGRCLQCDLRLTMASVAAPPEKLQPFDAEHVGQAPEGEGAFILFDQNKEILVIQGVADMRRTLEEKLDSGSKAVFFECREDKMYSKAESELVQAYLQRHGKMPPGDGAQGGEDDLDDLF
ncbi:MAG: FAD-dependent oxidoreductase [Deltaproteobacteria bacterium]|nr:FAD-dependent oxidoreductase [Deltaproteobacteria bacterium]